MAIRKQTVAAAVEKVAKKAEPAESVSTNNAPDWDKLLCSGNEPATKSNDSTKEYEFFNGKDRLVRTVPGWGSAKNKLVKFVIYATDESGNPLPELPPVRFGSLSDLEYTEKKYPLSKGYFVADTTCRNGKHKINVYRIHIVDVIDKPEVEVE